MTNFKTNLKKPLTNSIYTKFWDALGKRKFQFLSRTGPSLALYLINTPTTSVGITSKEVWISALVDNIPFSQWLKCGKNSRIMFQLTSTSRLMKRSEPLPQQCWSQSQPCLPSYLKILKIWPCQIYPQWRLRHQWGHVLQGL